MTHSTGDTDARTDLQDLELGEALADEAVGVRDDAEPHAGRGERAEALAGARELTQPQCGIGELVVEMLVHLLALIVGSAALGHVAVEVVAPPRGPVELDVVGGKGARAGVVRTIEDLAPRRELRPRANAPRMRSCDGHEEDPADVEQHGFRAGGKASRKRLGTVGKPTGGPGPGWYR